MVDDEASVSKLYLAWVSEGKFPFNKRIDSGQLSVRYRAKMSRKRNNDIIRTIHTNAFLGNIGKGKLLLKIGGDRGKLL